MAEHNSASRSGGKSALQEDTYCLEQDCFGDEESAADMIGRVSSHREAELVSLQIFLFLQGNQQEPGSDCFQTQTLYFSVGFLLHLFSASR